MVYAQPSICPGKLDALSNFEIQTNHLISARQLDLIISKVNKVVDCSRGQPEGSFFNSYYTEV